MTAEQTTDPRHPALSRPRLWLEFVAGPGSWGALLLVMYFSVSVFRSQGDGFVRGLLLVLGAVAAVAALAGLAGSLRSRRAIASTDARVARTDSRQAFMATTAAFAAALFLFGVALLVLPVFMLGVNR